MCRFCFFVIQLHTTRTSLIIDVQEILFVGKMSTPDDVRISLPDTSSWHLVSASNIDKNMFFKHQISLFWKFVQILWRIDRKGKQSKISIKIFFHNFTYSCGVEKGIHNFLNRVKIFIEKEKLFFLLLLLFNDGTILESRNKKMTKLLIREKKIFFFPFFF